MACPARSERAIMSITSGKVALNAAMRRLRFIWSISMGTVLAAAPANTASTGAMKINATTAAATPIKAQRPSSLDSGISD